MQRLAVLRELAHDARKGSHRKKKEFSLLSCVCRDLIRLYSDGERERERENQRRHIIIIHDRIFIENSDDSIKNIRSIYRLQIHHERIVEYIR